MYVNRSWKVFFVYSKANTGANKSIKKKNIGETTVISLFCNAVLTLTWCQCSSCGAAKAGMWKERGGEGLDSRLSHRGHTRSSLWDEFTCCRVWSLVAQKDNKLSDTPLPIEALKAKDKKKQSSWNAPHLCFKCPVQKLELYSSWWEACLLTFLLWEILRAPKSLNNDDVGEFTGSIYEKIKKLKKAVNLRGVI